MKEFEEYKQSFINKCKAEKACQGEFARLLKASTIGELWLVLLENREWCEEHNIYSEIEKGITLPTSIGGYLDLSGCDLKGITLPKKFDIIK